jgi:hypothetical protein
MPLQNDLSQYAKPGPYTTHLDPMQEMNFRSWVLKNDVPFDFNQHPMLNDYDMRGFWKDNPNHVHEEGSHFPDTYKTPLHQSFSNESKYALPTAPSWQGNQLIDNNGNIVFSE